VIPHRPERLRRAALRGLDVSMGLEAALRGRARALDALAGRTEPRTVVVLGLYRRNSAMADACTEILRSRHEVHLRLGALDGTDARLATHTVMGPMNGGKPANVNALWREWVEDKGAALPAWTIVIDDDVRLPARFLDRFLAACEAFEFVLAQPAQSRRSHAAWQVARRRARSLARQTSFVEIGPVTAFSARAARELLPWPELRWGWGLDQHWAHVARERGWRLGVVDATPVRHESQAIAASYDRTLAGTEADEFLASHPHLSREEANVTVRRYLRAPHGP
jgi:hypothetical protein